MDVSFLELVCTACRVDQFYNKITCLNKCCANKSNTHKGPTVVAISRHEIIFLSTIITPDKLESVQVEANDPIQMKHKAIFCDEIVSCGVLE